VHRLDRVALGLVVVAVVLFAVGVVAALRHGGDGDEADLAQAAVSDRDKLARRTLTIVWVGDTMLGSADHAAPDDGAPLFAHVAPLLRRADVAAGNLEGVDVMKELPATLVLRPFNSDTLAVVAYQLARDERLGEAALPSLALVLVGLAPVILLSRTLRAPRR